ncbi:MAG: hypothetical protein ABSD78_07780 [Acidimicrobiales bacterium]
MGFERPPVDRFEYRFEVATAESRYDLILDPANPMRAPGAFGERSVIEFPEYQPPAWVPADRARGETQEIDVPSALLGDAQPAGSHGATLGPRISSIFSERCGHEARARRPAHGPDRGLQPHRLWSLRSAGTRFRFRQRAGPATVAVDKEHDVVRNEPVASSTASCRSALVPAKSRLLVDRASRRPFGPAVLQPACIVVRFPLRVKA